MDFVEFGILSLEDILDPSMISDEDLRVCIGLRTLQLRKFRVAVERYHEGAMRIARCEAQRSCSLMTGAWMDGFVSCSMITRVVMTTLV